MSEPDVDPRLYAGRYTGRVPNLQATSSDDGLQPDNDVIFAVEDPNVVTSMAFKPRNAFQQMHLPVLDLDFGATLKPSSTDGHFHLYLERHLNWEDYVKLLDVLGEIGILEPGYVSASKRRGYTAVRLPWITKEQAAQVHDPEPLTPDNTDPMWS